MSFSQLLSDSLPHPRCSSHGPFCHAPLAIALASPLDRCRNSPPRSSRGPYAREARAQGDVRRGLGQGERGPGPRAAPPNYTRT
eukprot:3558891-Pyramimonas_sp.AAC.1